MVVTALDRDGRAVPYRCGPCALWVIASDGLDFPSPEQPGLPFEGIGRGLGPAYEHERVDALHVVEPGYGSVMRQTDVRRQRPARFSERPFNVEQGNDADRLAGGF